MKMLSTGITAATLALALMAAPLTAQVAETSSRFSGATMAAGINDGTLRAESTGTGGYFAGGLVSGVFLGLIGTGITYAVAATSDVSVPASQQAEISEGSPEYAQGYRTGFGDRVKAKRKQSALMGGLLGTAVGVVILLSASGG